MRATAFVATVALGSTALLPGAVASAEPGVPARPRVASAPHVPSPRPSTGKPTSAPSASPPRAPAAPSAGAGCDPERADPGPPRESWAQKRLGFQRAWALTMGRGVTAAVIDSGADPGHPMLAGRVPGALDLTGTGDRDCVGHGTGVAAIIGGRDLSGRKVPLSGVAPAVRLLIIKQQNAGRDDGGGDRLPAAIRKAADEGAQVVNVSIRTGDSAALRAAVAYAQSKDAVIVAAAGNARKKNGDDGAAYPAGYPGVLSVASLGEGGGRAETSSLQSRVDVGAPGQGVPVAWTGGGYKTGVEGTSYAAAFVSGVASLVRSHRPRLDREQVVQRILTTAEGNVGAGTGRGMVDPVQAVTAVVPGETGASAVASRAPAGPARLAAPVPVDGRTRGISLTVAAGTLGAAGVAALAGVAIPLGRRRGWRPGRVTLVERPAEEEPVAEGPDRGTIGAPH